MDINNKNSIPDFLINKLENQYKKEDVDRIIDGFTKRRELSIRVNTLKTEIEAIKSKLINKNIQFEEIEWSKEALILKNIDKKKIEDMDIYKNGEIYMQSLSSMLPPIILKPKENTDILDMCAAPRK